MIQPSFNLFEAIFNRNTKSPQFCTERVDAFQDGFDSRFCPGFVAHKLIFWQISTECQQARILAFLTSQRAVRLLRARPLLITMSEGIKPVSAVMAKLTSVQDKRMSHSEPRRGGIPVAHGASRGKLANQEERALVEGGIIFNVNGHPSGKICAPTGAQMLNFAFTHDSRHGLLICRPCRGSEHRSLLSRTDIKLR